MQGGPLSPDEYRVASPPALLHQPAPVIVVAIDRDRNSQLAAKWVVDHLLSGASQIVLLHVAAHYPANHGFAMAETTQSALEAEMKEIFVPYRGFFNRNGVDVFEVVLEEADVSKAILGYITANKIQSIALGGASRNAFTKKFKNADVPSTLMKCAPDYCNIYVVAKGKSVNVRLAKCGVPPMHGGADSPSDTDSVRESGLYIRRGSRGHGHLPPVMPDARRSMDGRSTLPELTTRPPFRERSLPSSATKNVVVLPGKDYSEAPSRSARHDSFGGDLDFGPSTRFSSMDFGDNLDLTASPAREPMSPGGRREGARTGCHLQPRLPVPQVPHRRDRDGHGALLRRAQDRRGRLRPRLPRLPGPHPRRHQGAPARRAPGEEAVPAGGGGAQLHPPPQHGAPPRCVPRVRLPRVRVHGARQPRGPAVPSGRHAADPVGAAVPDRGGDRDGAAVPAPDKAGAAGAPGPEAGQHPAGPQLREQDQRRRAGASGAAVGGGQRDAVPADGDGGHLLLHRPGVPADGEAGRQVGHLLARRAPAAGGHRAATHGAHAPRREGHRRGHLRADARHHRQGLARRGGARLRKARAQVHGDAAEGPAGPRNRRTAGAQPVKEPRPRVRGTHERRRDQQWKWRK
ncbi:Protein kinase protein with adenine nucleotide alpha hydrolase-like domain [Zea mays]|uniref:RING-type E3 ubiquitin transferase n=1 Tax=Zea mays TaxID=4577 RepID=A0A1D6NKJ6_MAIZE|nr:Protein kinase protein with adenine nucleotide alpha hydrolase-like domain [Zea mays]